jgi:seryl-tRNA synthetase
MPLSKFAQHQLSLEVAHTAKSFANLENAYWDVKQDSDTYNKYFDACANTWTEDCIEANKTCNGRVAFLAKDVSNVKKALISFMRNGKNQDSFNVNSALNAQIAAELSVCSFIESGIKISMDILKIESGA